MLFSFLVQQLKPFFVLLSVVSCFKICPDDSDRCCLKASTVVVNVEAYLPIKAKEIITGVYLFTKIDTFFCFFFVYVNLADGNHTKLTAHMHEGCYREIFCVDEGRETG